MPANSLLNQVTDSGWTVTEKITNTSSTGGTFCVQYLVTHENGQTGFLKALDFSRAFGRDILEMQKLVNEYIFENNILRLCDERNMTRVITPLDAGKIAAPVMQPPYNEVYYLIFELADGDFRNRHLEVTQKHWVPSFKAIHHVAVGITQLHAAGIAHQDIKPSNILCFDGKGSKISDLGRVTDRNGTSPFSSLPFPGDRNYAPPEHFYAYNPSCTFEGRISSDIFMVGSLLYHIVTDIQINASLFDEYNKIINGIPINNYSDALPILNTAFGTVLNDLRKQSMSLFNQSITDQLLKIITEMCNPDVTKRGKKGIGEHPPKMNRYVGMISNLVRETTTSGIK